MADENPAPAFPAWKAFVVQFSRETRDFTATCAGRIEHLSSGRRIQFTSPAELLQALERLLAASGDGSGN
jgi:hypothetical protein